jgi:hypothetical protein
MQISTYSSSMTMFKFVLQFSVLQVVNFSIKFKNALDATRVAWCVAANALEVSAAPV